MDTQKRERELEKYGGRMEYSEQWGREINRGRKRKRKRENSEKVSEKERERKTREEEKESLHHLLTTFATLFDISLSYKLVQKCKLQGEIEIGTNVQHHKEIFRQFTYRENFRDIICEFIFVPNNETAEIIFFYRERIKPPRM